MLWEICCFWDSGLKLEVKLVQEEKKHERKYAVGKSGLYKEGALILGLGSLLREQKKFLREKVHPRSS